MVEKVVVDRLELVRERIDPGNREPEVRVELVGDAECVGLEAESQQAAIAVEGVPGVQNGEVCKICGGQRDSAEALGLHPDEPHDPACGSVRLDSLNPHRLAEKRLAASRLPVKFELVSGEHLPMPDNSYDAVVSTWTLCSIPDVLGALKEIRRVMKPEGKFYFVEHGLSPDPKIARWQHRLTPIQKVIGDGCHLNRDTLKLIEQAGLKTLSYRQFEAEGLPAIGAFMTLGVAGK